MGVAEKHLRLRRKLSPPSYLLKWNPQKFGVVCAHGGKGAGTVQIRLQPRARESKREEMRKFAWNTTKQCPTFDLPSNCVGMHQYIWMGENPHPTPLPILKRDITACSIQILMSDEVWMIIKYNDSRDGKMRDVAIVNANKKYNNKKLKQTSGLAIVHSNEQYHIKTLKQTNEPVLCKFLFFRMKLRSALPYSWRSEMAYLDAASSPQYHDI